MRTAIALTLLINAVVQPAQAEQLRLESARLLGAKTISCTLLPGAMANWLKGSPTMDVEQFTSTAVIIIRSIDIPNRSAIFVGNVGEAAVEVSARPFALHFLERTEVGGLNTT